MDIPHEIDQDENLGRGIFSSNQAKRARRAIPKNVFLEKTGEIELSVDRLSIAPLQKAVENADTVAKKRNRNFYGWAVLTTSDARKNGRKVVASPLDHNQYHSNILLPQTAAEDKEIQIVHAQQLADASDWKARPK